MTGIKAKAMELSSAAYIHASKSNVGLMKAVKQYLYKH